METHQQRRTIFTWSWSEVEKMETTKLNRTLSLFVIFGLLVMAITYAVSSNPSKPTQITGNYTSNMTNSYPDGSKLNGTRGYIYNLTINESQPSQKWIGYVGNVQGEYALQDSSSNAIYDWDIVTITGELYITKEGPFVNLQKDTAGQAGGTPSWAALTCANSSMLSTEEAIFNHTTTDEDSFTNTFTSGAAFSNPGFYAGENEIADNDCIGSCTCAGAYMNSNNADQSTDWVEVVLTDLTYQNKSSKEDSVKHYDLIYASLLENDTTGFDGNIYDFQVLLPQSGLEGSQANVAYYFYIELI